MPPMKRKKACQLCRSQKAKCDAEPPRICSRRRRMGLLCVLSSDTNARQTKAQLQHELDQLKMVEHSGQDKYRSVWTENQIYPATATGASVDMVSVASQPSMPTLPHGDIQVSSADYGPPNSVPNFYKTSSRILDGDEIEGWKIQHCFMMFFRNNHPLLPMTDPDINADDCFDMSPLLFWTIVFIGSRRYRDDPTLMGRLSPKMNCMALASLESRTHPLQTIQALLLLCVWPVPMNTGYRDMSLVLSGAAINLSMQNGLHIIGTGQDFARERLTVNETTRTTRAKLWADCVVICNYTSLREGVPPLSLPGTSGDDMINGALLERLSPEMRTWCEIHGVLMSATAALIRGLIPANGENSSTGSLSHLIRLFDTQFVAISSKVQDSMNTIYLLCCRIHLLAYHFLEEQSPHKIEGLLCLYTVACDLVRLTMSKTEPINLVEHCPIFVDRTVFLAAVAILKIRRSDELAPIIDSEAGDRALLHAIIFSRQTSLQSGDLGARGSELLIGLMASKRLFRRQDGKVDGLETRIKSRLSTSIVFDAFWWWREEFTGQPSPYNDDSELQGQETPTEQELGVLDPIIPEASSSLSVAGAADDTPMLLNEGFPDDEWAATVDFSHFLWTPTEGSNEFTG
ncbi:hypothetical protein F4804DRAFT_308180 [Jackrogersella minutella]|nr:hypothetical protein F4804DRAFT_308180 [Jackrogersella minutella]